MPTAVPPSPSPAELPTTGTRQRIVIGLLGLALLPLLTLNLDPFAPIRQGLGAQSPMAKQADRLNALTTPIVQLAPGRDVELHFDRAPQLPAAADNLADALYYGLNYAMYPARAYLGNGREIINGGEPLRKADQVPTPSRLRELGVAAVVTFPLDAKGLHRPNAVAVR